MKPSLDRPTPRKLFYFVLGTAVLLGACSSRRIQLNQDSTTQTCGTPMSVSMAPVNRNINSIRVGENVIWKVEAHGCTGNYIVEHGIQNVPFTSQAPAMINTTYSSAGDKIELFVVRSVNSAQEVLEVGSFSTPSFNVKPAAACTATPSSATVSVPVNGSGQPSAPVRIDFEVAANYALTLQSISQGGTAVPASRLSKALPLASSALHHIGVTVQTTGTHTFSFAVQNTEIQASCVGSVNVVALNVDAPLMTELTIDRPVAWVQEERTVHIQTQGVTDSIVLSFPAGTLVGADTIAAARTGDSFSQVIRTQAVGNFIATATAYGPGGSSTRQFTVRSGPRLDVRITKPLKQVPGTFEVELDVEGAYTGILLQGQNMDSLNLPGSPTGIRDSRHQVQVRSIVENPIPFNVSAFAGNETGAYFSYSWLLSPEAVDLPSITLTANGDSFASYPEVHSTVSINWSTVGATHCHLFVSGQTAPVLSALSGSHQIQNINRVTAATVVCSNSSRQNQRTIYIRPTGKWFAAPSQSCQTRCAQAGLGNQPSPEGALCMSGRIRPPSSGTGIAFPYGCANGNCTANLVTATPASSQGDYCYAPSQDRTHEPHDLTVGCYCGTIPPPRQ